MRVYHFVNRKYGLQDLQQRRLKIALIDELNDPFELLGFASRDPEVRRAYATLKAILAQYFGLVCFSGDWRNPVQWSHYADRHRGLCLGFDVSHGLVPVTYTSRRLIPDMAAASAGGVAAQEHALQMLTTKFSHWRYEDEHRLVVGLEGKFEKGLYYYRFCKRVALREVIIGHNSTISRDELTRALGNMARYVDMWKARLAFRSFRIVRQKADKLWD